jgi:hypothetical protein
MTMVLGEGGKVPKVSVRRTSRRVRLMGDIDVLTAPQVKAKLLEASPRDGSALVVDMFQVARALTGDLVLLHPTAGVRRLFRTIGAERAPGLTIVYDQAA